MMSRFVIETHQLGRDFRHTTAVNKVQLQVESGVIAGIIGPNGAGKTTLLHLVAGLLEPTRGRCSVLGHPARRLPGALASQIICVGDRTHVASKRCVRSVRHVIRSTASCRTGVFRDIAMVGAQQGASPLGPGNTGDCRSTTGVAHG